GISRPSDGIKEAVRHGQIPEIGLRFSDDPARLPVGEPCDSDPPSPIRISIVVIHNRRDVFSPDCKLDVSEWFVSQKRPNCDLSLEFRLGARNDPESSAVLIQPAIPLRA